MSDRAHDAVGEAGDEFPDVSDEARAELEALLSEWASRHVTCDFWSVDGEAEWIKPKEQPK